MSESREKTMSEARFNVVFSGQIVTGADPSKVRANLAAAFRMDVAKVEALFSGKRVVVKKDADQATAMKFRAVMKQAGAQAELERLAEGSAEGGDDSESSAAPAAQTSSVPAPVAAATPTPAAPAPAPTTASPVFTSGSLETVGTIRTSGTGFSGQFEVAPAGATIAVERNLPPPVVPDVSQFSLAPAGADIGDKKQEKASVAPDISHLKIEPL